MKMLCHDDERGPAESARLAVWGDRCDVCRRVVTFPALGDGGRH